MYMKKILLTALVVLMPFPLAACKKSSPVDLFKQIENVALANGANSSDPDDCANAAARVTSFYYANIQDWKNSIKEMKAEGKSCDQVLEILRLEDGCEQITSLDLRCHSEIIGVCNDIDLSLFSWVSALYKGECSI